MAYIQPTSEVWLCANVPLDPSYDNQLTFTSGSGASRVWDSSAQRAYFASKAVYHPTNFSIVKERDGVLRMSGEVSNFYNINYMYFVNPPFTSGVPTKYFYAFVTQVEYINPNTTFIYFELDYFQTWAADIVWMESVIEREHVEDDRMYVNLEDEGIEVNEMDPYEEVYLDDALGQKILVIGSTQSYIQMLEQVQAEGLTIPYNPFSDYPILNGGVEARAEYTKIVDLKCYANSQPVSYSSYNYNYNTDLITINGIEDLGIDTIYFSLTYVFSSDSVERDRYYVKGVRNGTEWTFSIDGFRIEYNPYTDAPDLDAGATVKNVILGNLKDANENLITNYSKKFYEKLIVVGGRDKIIILYGGITPENGWTQMIDLQVTTLSTPYYAIKATYNGSTWSYSIFSQT